MNLVSSTSTPSAGISHGAIAGIVVGALGAIIALLLLVALLCPGAPGPLTCLEWAVWGERRVARWGAGVGAAIWGRSSIDNRVAGMEEYAIGYWTGWMCRIGTLSHCIALYSHSSITEITLFLLSTLTILQALYALQYPPPPLPPLASPAQRRAMERMVERGQGENLSMSMSAGKSQSQSTSQSGIGNWSPSPLNPNSMNTNTNGGNSGKRVQFSPVRPISRFNSYYIIY